MKLKLYFSDFPKFERKRIDLSIPTTGTNGATVNCAICLNLVSCPFVFQVCAAPQGVNFYQTRFRVRIKTSAVKVQESDSPPA